MLISLASGTCLVDNFCYDHIEPRKETQPKVTVYEELVAAAETTDFAPKSAGESKSAYLTRLMRAIYKLERADWFRLSQPARQWYEESARRFNARQPVEECPGYDDAKEMKEPAPLENGGLTDAVRKAVLMHPDFAKDEILKVLEADGWDIKQLRSNQTVVVVRSVTLKTIKLAKEIGRWNETPAGANA